MANWATTAEADAYLIDKVGTDAWFATGLNTDAYLTTAHRLIEYDPDLTIPSSPDAAQLVLLQYAEIELAFYILSNPGYTDSLNSASRGVSSERIGNYSVSYDTKKSGREFEGVSRYPVEVSQYLNSFIKTAEYFVKINRAQEDIV